MLELGGLVVKSGIEDLTGDDRAMIYGAMIWIADKLQGEDGDHARGVWTGLGKMTFEVDQTGDVFATPPKRP